jgi:DNA polymerase gamma 1
MIVRRCLCHIVRFSVNHYRLISDRRINPLGIQMLSSKLHEQLFSSVGEPVYSDENIEKSKVHLKQFELGLNNSEKLDDIELDLPKLEGKNLNEHFETIARQQSEPYVDLIHQLIQADIPQQPTQWKYVKGWTKFV